MSNIEDTIYDLPNEEYHRGERFKDFLSSTQIKDYMVSPKFARYKVYQFFEHERTGVWKEFYWVMQQKIAPYDAVFVSAANWAFHLEDGIVKMGASALAFKKLLDQHVYCTQNNDFDGAQIFIQPGFKGRRIMVPDTPAFEKNKMFNFYNNQEQ